MQSGATTQSFTAALRSLTRHTPRIATGIAAEIGWTAAHLMLYPLGLRPDRGTTERTSFLGSGRRSPMTSRQRGLIHHRPGAAQTPILLVHGIIDNHSIFAVLDRALRQRGFQSLTSYDYGLLTADVTKAASRLGEVIEKLAATSGFERIHVIGHSLGGLIARYYVQRLGGDAFVDTLVTLGTPHQGTQVAYALGLVPLVRQLQPGSPLIAELAQPAPGCRTRFIAFHSDLDHLVGPRQNAMVVHPDLLATNIAVHRVGHLSMPHDRRIAFDIALALQDLDPNSPRVDRPAP